MISKLKIRVQFSSWELWVEFFLKNSINVCNNLNFKFNFLKISISDNIWETWLEKAHQNTYLFGSSPKIEIPTETKDLQKTPFPLFNHPKLSYDPKKVINPIRNNEVKDKFTEVDKFNCSTKDYDQNPLCPETWDELYNFLRIFYKNFRKYPDQAKYTEGDDKKLNKRGFTLLDLAYSLSGPAQHTRIS